MITAVLTFAFLSALFEMILILKLAPMPLLQKNWFQVTVHTLVIVANLAIHFGTITGTMTAITAGLVSFATVPMCCWAKSFWHNYKAQSENGPSKQI